jgi:hypothetical protein
MLTQLEARKILYDCLGDDMWKDFHTLRSYQVEALVRAAKERRYRKRHDAPGSTGRMFCQYLQRRASINGDHAMAR